MDWHHADIEKVFEQTGSSVEGLTEDEAGRRLAENGYNELAEKKKKPAWLFFIGQFNDFMILVLVVAAIISGIIGDTTDTVIILVIVVLNALFGFIQEYRAEKAMESLKKLAALTATVKRNGEVASIPSVELVPGDVVLLEAGSVVSADMRLFESHLLQVEEASLTGESVAVRKTSDSIGQVNIPLGDRLNMAYKSTQVTNGRGAGVVVATGMDTEIGRIAGMLQEKRSGTPLQKRMTDFGKKLSYFVLLICAILLGVGILKGEDPMRMLLVSISLAVAAIPEALPALITIGLAIGAKRMVKKNALIRKLPAVETLGSVTYICTDKTGTLTQNKMTVTEVIPYPETIKLDNDISVLECAMAINHDANKTNGGNWWGDPTETAMVRYIENKYGQEKLKKLLQAFPRVAELPFDPDRKCMTTIHRYNGRLLAISKGAVESITAALKTSELNEKILTGANVLAENGIRVLAYGYRELDNIPQPFDYKQIEKGLDFMGLAGLTDPPREGVKEAIEECKSAGINSVMITGDHKGTATAIARQTGILSGDELVVTGSELDRMKPGELDGIIERIKVYARVSPEQKMNIIKTLQRKNHFVAMTGDGVNDAPSLRIANIGIAMGINGTDVSKDAADITLLDDHYATIVRAVKEGRRIYDNIRKFVKYIMTCNSAEIWTIFLAPLLGLPIPLLPVHILWINLVTDGLPGLALSTEREENNIMKRPPRKTDESLFAHGTGFHIIWVGLLMAFLTLGTQAWAVHTGNPYWQTMVFTVLSLAQLGHVLAIRSDYELTYRKGLFTNLPLMGAVSFTFVLQLGVIYLPVANRLFKTQPLPVSHLLACVLIASIVFHAVELEKWLKNKSRKH